MNFPSGSVRVEYEQVKLIVAGVFLSRLVIDQRAFNSMLIALGANIFLWIMDVLSRNYSIHRAMFGLFGDTDLDITADSAVGVKRSVEVESLLSSGSDDTSDCFVSLAFDAIDMTAFLSEL